MNMNERLSPPANEAWRYQLLIENITDYAIFMLDPTGVITSWNAGAERFKQYTSQEIIGRHFSIFYTDEDRQTDLPSRGLEIARREGKFENEGWRVRKDGTRFWANVIIDAVRSSDGELVGFAKITRDLTERRQAERALEETREALFQSQKMEVIGQLTGGVAHDFNNLLAAVMGSLELAMKRLGGADARVTSLLQNALEGARRGSALTQRMLAFARRQDLRLEPISVRSLVDSMSFLLRPSLGPRISLENRVSTDLPCVKADINQIEMALLNLAMNARDAMPDGGSLVIDAREEIIGVSSSPRLSPGSYVCLSVTDQGEGMDRDTLQKAVEPFFTTKGVGKGTGLGLSMVKGLAEQSGGELRLYSTKGQGACAELWLPVAQAAPALQSPAESRRVNGEQKALRILAVDDDALVLMNTVAVLEELGHDVLEAGSGIRALEILRSGELIDVVVTDQAMPHMTGLELASAIHEEWPQVKLVLATGYGELPTRSQFRFAKLSKPFLEKDLARAITEVVNAAPQRAFDTASSV